MSLHKNFLLVVLSLAPAYALAQATEPCPMKSESPLYIKLTKPLPDLGGHYDDYGYRPSPNELNKVTFKCTTVAGYRDSAFTNDKVPTIVRKLVGVLDSGYEVDLGVIESYDQDSKPKNVTADAEEMLGKALKPYAVTDQKVLANEIQFLSKQMSAQEQRSEQIKALSTLGNESELNLTEIGKVPFCLEEIRKVSQAFGESMSSELNNVEKMSRTEDGIFGKKMSEAKYIHSVNKLRELYQKFQDQIKPLPPADQKHMFKKLFEKELSHFDQETINDFLKRAIIIPPKAEYDFDQLPDLSTDFILPLAKGNDASLPFQSKLLFVEPRPGGAPERILYTSTKGDKFFACDLRKFDKSPRLGICKMNSIMDSKSKTMKLQVVLPEDYNEAISINSFKKARDQHIAYVMSVKNMKYCVKFKPILASASKKIDNSERGLAQEKSTPTKAKSTAAPAAKKH